MKLRVRSGSLRLRLSQKEVERLRDTGSVEERLDVAPGAALSWTIAAADVEAVRVSLDGARLRVEAPRATVRAWCETEEVGFGGTEGALTVLIEKDWECLKPRGEDDADAFPHPANVKRT